jgi:ferredoxin, 2Fe-2S
MPTITFTQPSGETTIVTVADGTTLMRAAVTYGVDGIIGECGGQAMCATCHIYVRPEYTDRLPAIGDDEDEMLDCTAAVRSELSRLACQVQVGAELPEIAVDIPSEQV